MKVIAKGFSQIVGMDYDGTYALVINPKSIRMMFAIAATQCTWFTLTLGWLF